ncbi:MAG: metallophosphoesterase [Vicingaceae bacterium]
MRSRIVILFLLLTVIFLLELYTYSGLFPYLNQLKNGEYYWIVYYALAALSLISAYVLVRDAGEIQPGILKKASSNVMGGLALTLILTKLAFVSVIFTEDVYRLVLLIYQNGLALFNDADPANMVSRNAQMAKLGLAFAMIPLVSFVHGITLGKYKFRVKRIRLHFNDLPQAFDGYRIVQFSDMHSGSFDSLKRVQKGMEKMQAEGADLILFTGDMVNNHADEVKPFVSMLKNLKAVDGKFSILGNHDYGDYIHWASIEKKMQNLVSLIGYQEEAGFKLLMNEGISLKRGEERIKLLGVENWGKPPFPQHGDLNAALKDVKNDDFVILMSHDPSHWDLEVIKQKKKIHLTLSGHTHGMQFGFDIPGLKWSPVKYKYPRWSGLYCELDRYLYVNNGFGFLGFPGRVGIYPEITVIELKVKD